MKTRNNNSVSHTFWILVLALIIGCSKDDSPPEPIGNGTLVEGPGLSANDIITYEGEIGIILSTRAIAKKGYSPKTIEITVEASSGNFNATLEINELTYLSQLKQAIDKLTDQQFNELTNGVNISVRVLDNNGQTLADETFSNVSFVTDPNEKEINSDGLQDLFNYIDLKPGTSYTIQYIRPGMEEVDGAPYSVQYTTGKLDYPGSPLFTRRGLDFDDNTTRNYTTFEFTPVPGKKDVYTIGVRDQDNTNKIYYLYIIEGEEGVYVESRFNWNQRGSNFNAIGSDYFHFIIKKTPNGFYTIAPARNSVPLKFKTLVFYRDFLKNMFNDRREYEGLHFAANTSGDPAYFRIVALDINWEITAITTQAMDPILPPATTTFGFNSTLTNCSSGLLTTEVGSTQSTESSTATRWSESMAISTRNTNKTILNFAAQLAVPIRGATGTGSFSYTVEHSFTREISSTRTIEEVFSETETIELFSKRTQEVPPKSAILIADNYQAYDNIKVPYIQQLRIRGTLGGTSLTATEIITQLNFNGFDGVITAINDNAVDITLRANTTIDKIIDTEVISQDVPGACK